VGKLQGKEFGKDFGVLVHKGAKNDVQSKVEQAVQDGARVVLLNDISLKILNEMIKINEMICNHNSNVL
jgi:hypothetical protein